METTNNAFTETRNAFENLYNMATVNEESSQEEIDNAADYFGAEVSEDREETIENIREAILRDALCYDVRTTIDVCLTLGGPTVFIRFPVVRHNNEEEWELDGNATYHSTDNEAHTLQIVHLTEEETENLWEAYAVAYTSNN